MARAKSLNLMSFCRIKLAILAVPWPRPFMPIAFVHKQVGRLESGLTNIEGRLTTVETKLDQVRSEVASLNTTISTVKPLLVWVCRGILAILAFGLTVLGMWLKHHYGW